MDDEVPVVTQNPLALIVTFNTVGQIADLFQGQMNAIRNGLVLPGIGARADHEIIGKSRDFRQVKDCNIFRLFSLRGSNRKQPAGLVLNFFCFDI